MDLSPSSDFGDDDKDGEEESLLFGSSLAAENAAMTSTWSKIGYDMLVIGLEQYWRVTWKINRQQF